MLLLGGHHALDSTRTPDYACASWAQLQAFIVIRSTLMYLSPSPPSYERGMSHSEAMQENAVLHVRCTKLQELSTASDEQIMRQSDTIRRLEYYVDPDATSNVHLHLAQAQRSLQQLQQAVAVRACYLIYCNMCPRVNLDLRYL